MIVTEGPKLDVNLKKVTPWWDVVSRYLIAAMMAIALTSIVVQVSKDSVICVPAIDCSTTPNGSVNVSDDAAKLCKSLTPKSLKKTVLMKMVDRRFYDYVDSVCFQELTWFTKFFPLFFLGEAVLLLVLDMMWTTLPFSSSVLNDFVGLADEVYSQLGTANIILGKVEHLGDNNGEDTSKIQNDIELSANAAQDKTTQLNKKNIIPKEDALKVLDLADKAGKFKDKYEKSISLYKSYKRRIIVQILTCLVSLVVNLWDHKSFFNNTVHFECHIDEFIFTKEYEHFACSHPLAPYFQIAIIVFLFFLFLHFLTSCRACCKTKCCFKTGCFSDENNDLDFLLFLLEEHHGLFADKVSSFFNSVKHVELLENIKKMP